ncbi:hypothetical protein V2J09_022100 [Rumex salicifolius]
MTTGIVHDQNVEHQQIDRHMRGCMSGFFNIFDRNHVLSGKRLYPKRLPSPVVVEFPSGSVSSIGSPPISREFERLKPQELAKLTVSSDCPMTPAPATPPPATVPDVLTKSPVAMSSFELKDGIKSPWKFTRETPRLSLDSQLHPRGIKTTPAVAGGVRCDGNVGGACEDESERQRRSPSVVARLMGLGALPSSQSGGADLPEKKVELRRSASESRSRDLLHCRFTDGNNFPANLQNQSASGFATPNTRENGNDGRDWSNSNIDNFNRISEGAFHSAYSSWNANAEPARKPRRIATPQQLRKGSYDFGDFFPEPKPEVSSDDLEKRLKMRGIDEPLKDLETLKHILEALQLKGLLHHSNPPPLPASQIGRRNFVYDQRFLYEESPIVVMKPARSPRRLATEPSPTQFQSRTASRRNVPVTGGDSFSLQSPRRDRAMRNLTPTSPGRSESRITSPATARKKATQNLETQRRAKETTTEPRRVSPVRSPRVGNRRMDQTATQSPRRHRSTAEIRSGRAEDESSISESSFSTSSHTDTERSKTEDCYKDGKSLLERCDKLLHSIAEMTSASSYSSTELQPSPVSVLDSSFYKEESSPSPVMKRTIDFKDLEDELWSPSSSGDALFSKSSDTEDNTDDQQQDPDFAYVSDIIRASNYLQDDSDIFLLLEKQQSRKGTTSSSRLQRRLIFDTITEILDQNRQLSPWKSASHGSNLREVWSELQRIQKRDESEDMFEVICGVMKRDLNRDSINGWGECQLETSDAVLDIERLIFKDLIGETIRDLATFSGPPRRKLGCGGVKIYGFVDY